jgi:hypothetical protein
MIRLSGRMTPRVIASRSSATFLPEKSSGELDAAAAADSPVLRAPFAAVCCRPRALPPAFAARLRAGELEEPADRRVPDELDADLLDPEDLRALDPPDRDDEDPPDRAVLDLRAVDREPEPEPEPELRDDVDLRALDPPDRDDEDPDPLELLFRVELRPDPRPEDDPPPLPPVDSAISFPPQEASRPTRAAPDYLMPSAAVTYA